MRILPFKPLRPVTESVSRVASLPYDVVNADEARQLTEGNPLSMLNVVRAEIHFADGQNPYADAVYEKAVAHFQWLQSEGILKRESEDCLYLYQQRMGTHTQCGVVGLCRIDDYDNNLIKKHEKTRQDKEDDRTRLTSDMSANAGPVFLTYRDQIEINRQVDALRRDEKPLYDFVAADGIQHTVWRVSGGQNLSKAFLDVAAFYVADGHHRSASAARVGKMRKAVNSHHTGDEAYNGFLCVMFPASQLRILPYNRLVQDLKGMSEEDFLAAVKAIVPVVQTQTASPSQSGKVHMFLSNAWYELAFDPSRESDPVSRLDVSLLQKNILAPLLGIDDPRTSKRIDFAGGIRGTDYLEEQVKRGKAAVAFSMYPTTLDQLMEIADAGQIMPPKSTWFEPKLRSGLFIHTFETEAELQG
jgi:uncharacterized protein (DUF1015 family)